MSKHEKSDVLVHFDEDSEEFVFYSVRSRELEAIREKNFDDARLTVESFKSQAPDEAEKELGSIIFSLIDSFSNSQINIRDYKAINEKSKLEYISELEKDAHNGSPEAMYYLSIEYFGLARKERSFEYLEKSEELLKLSSNLGYEDATQKLKEHWNLIKNATLKALNSGNDTNK